MVSTQDRSRVDRAKRVRAVRDARVFREGLLTHYRGLTDIAPGEWSDFFPNDGKGWSPPDRSYLIERWGHDDTMSLAYALGRAPWNLQREVCRLRKQGVEIAYLRRG